VLSIPAKFLGDQLNAAAFSRPENPAQAKLERGTLEEVRA